MALLTLIVWERRWSELRRWELYAGLALQGLIIGPWVLAVARSEHGADALRALFWNNVVGRFTRIDSPPALDYILGHRNAPRPARPARRDRHARSGRGARRRAARRARPPDPLGRGSAARVPRGGTRRRYSGDRGTAARSRGAAARRSQAQPPVELYRLRGGGE